MAPGLPNPKLLVDWTTEEVQKWFLSSKYASLANRFLLDGKELANLTKEDFQKELGNIQGSVLYGAVRELNKQGNKDVLEMFSSIHKMYPSLDFKGPAAPIYTFVKIDFEMKDRQKQIRLLTDSICNSYIAFKTKSQIKKDWYLNSIIGGPGTGKTRLALESRSLVRSELQSSIDYYIESVSIKYKILSKENIKLEINKLIDLLDDSSSSDIYIDLSNGNSDEQFKNNWSNPNLSEKMFLFIMASKIFYPSTKLKTILSYMESNIDHLNIENVTKRILEYKGVNQLCIFLDLDEFQTFISNEDIIALKTQNKDNILIRRMAITVMSTCSQLSQYGIFVVPILSGTIDPLYLSIMPSTMYSMRNVVLSSIDKKSSIELIENTSTSLPADRQIPQSLVSAMGGIPRALECLSQLSQSSSWNTHQELFELVKTQLEERYGSLSFIANTYVYLLKLALSGVLVSKEDKMPSGTPIGELEQYGGFFLQQVKHDQYRVIVPLVFASVFAKKISNSTKIDVSILTYRPILQYSDFEKFGRDFEAFKNNVMINQGITNTTFGERFHGALMTSTLANTILHLQPMSTCSSKTDKMPINTTLIETQEGGTIDISKKSVATWFGRNCTGGDILTSYPNQENNEAYYHIQEWKSTMPYGSSQDKSKNIYPGEIEKEKKDTYAVQFNGKVFFTFFTNKSVPSINTYFEGKQKGKDATLSTVDDSTTMLVTSF